MNDNKTTIEFGGSSVCLILTIIFVFLKAFGKIDWSWWWVFAPLWIPAAVVIVIIIVILTVFFIKGLARGIARRKRGKMR